MGVLVLLPPRYVPAPFSVDVPGLDHYNVVWSAHALLDFTFVCPTEIIEFSNKAEEFRKAGIEVLGCSVDSEFVHLAWVQTPRKQGGLGEIHFPLIADITHEISKKYGVYIEEDGHTIRFVFLTRLIPHPSLSSYARYYAYLFGLSFSYHI